MLPARRPAAQRSRRLKRPPGLGDERLFLFAAAWAFESIKYPKGGLVFVYFVSPESGELLWAAAMLCGRVGSHYDAFISKCAEIIVNAPEVAEAKTLQTSLETETNAHKAIPNACATRKLAQLLSALEKVSAVCYGFGFGFALLFRSSIISPRSFVASWSSLPNHAAA